MVESFSEREELFVDLVKFNMEVKNCLVENMMPTLDTFK